MRNSTLKAVCTVLIATAGLARDGRAAETIIAFDAKITSVADDLN